jgi:hypothetical protein
MVETMLIAAAAASVASAAVGTATAVSSSNQAAKAAGRQAQQAQTDALAEANAANENSSLEIKQLDEDRKAQQTAAQQEQAKVWREAGMIASAGIASRAAGGLNPYSMTGKALLDETLANAAADLEIIQGNAGRADSRNRLAQEASAQRAKVTGDRAARTAQQVALTSKTQADSARIQAYGQIGQGIASSVRGLSSAGSQYMSRA